MSNRLTVRQGLPELTPERSMLIPPDGVILSSSGNTRLQSRVVHNATSTSARLQYFMSIEPILSEIENEN